VTLHDKHFERALRRRVKAAIRSSPSLRSEYRRARRRSTREGGPWMLRGLVTTGFLLSMTKVTGGGASVDALLGVLTLWCACFSVYYANRLRFQLYSAPELLVMVLQPMSDAAIFVRQWRRWGWVTLWLLGDALGALAIIFFHTPAGLVQWIAAVPCALALWMSAVSLAALFVWRRPSANYGGFASAVFLLLATVIIAGVYSPSVVARVLEGASGPFYLLPPFGWINYVVRESVLGSALLPLLLLGPVALLAPGLHYARKRLAEHYQLVAAGPSEAGDVDDTDARTETADSAGLPIRPAPAANGTPAKPDPAAVAAIADAWRTPLSLRESGGWIEKLVSRWLTTRELDVGEFMTAGQTDWTRALRRSVILVLAALLAAVSLGPSGLWICYVGLYLAISTGLPLLGTSCVGFATVHLSGASFPAYAGLPVAFGDTGRFLIKVGVVRTAAFLPAALVAGAVVGHVVDAGWVPGFWIAAKLLVLIICWQPVLATYQFSAGTNDTRGPFWRVMKLVVLLGPLLLALVGASAAGIVAPPRWAIGGLLAAAFISWGTYRLYGRFYSRNAFDLMSGLPQ
jgi:hypothetical protein